MVPHTGTEDVTAAHEGPDGAEEDFVMDEPPPPSPPPKNRRRGTDYSSLNQLEALSWTQWWREQRHSPCVMRPTTVLIIIVIAALSLVGLVLQIPTFVLGLVLSPLMRRMPWFVEFIYPAGIARSVHIALMQWGLNSKIGRGSGVKGKNGRLMPPQHSRSVEQRTEVVKGRVYVHPIPQLLDNVGYLVVCCPPPDSGDGGKNSILGILVDCGDAKSALAQVELIRDAHYSELPGKPKITIHSVLCTHKHHDHTAGNRHLLADKNTAATLKTIVGGAVENVPYCTHPVKNGERVKLPKSGNNDMSDLIEIECIAVPSHTRGSIVYALRNLAPNGNIEGNGFVSHIFSGDAMFSGGSGVPFESDIETSADKNANTKNRNSIVKVTAGRCSIERCFAEVLFRTTMQIQDSDEGNNGNVITVGSEHPRRVLMFPGHEYTADLLLRQLDPSNEHHGHWTKLPPAVFFETASQYLISSHRRTLPKNGRLLTVPSSLDRELRINPHFRALKKRGDHLITAVRVWYRYISRTRREEAQNAALNLAKPSSSSIGNAKSFGTSSAGDTRNRTLTRMSSNGKTPSTESSWTMNANDINRLVFATVYSSDLDAVISELQSGNLSGASAAKRLHEMRTKLEEPVVTRRPIPGTLPSEKDMYLAVVALALLGSPPCGMTVRDGVVMNLPVPVDSSDEIIISKRRIISMLALLGLLDGPSASIASDNKDQGEEPCIVEMIEILWREAHFDSEAINSSDLALSDEGKTNEPTDPEEPTGDEEDAIELGLLKMTLNGAALNQPSWFKKYCLPCGSKADTQPAIPVPPSIAKMRRSGGELVRHDIHVCPMCRYVVTGSAIVTDGAGAVFSDAEEEEEEEQNDNGGSDEDFHQSPLMEGCGDSSDGEGSGLELQIISSL